MSIHNPILYAMMHLISGTHLSRAKTTDGQTSAESEHAAHAGQSRFADNGIDAESVALCVGCGEYVHESEMVRCAECNDAYCDNCTDAMLACNECGEMFCEACADDVTVSCSDCGVTCCADCASDSFTEIDGDLYCADCATSQ